MGIALPAFPQGTRVRVRRGEFPIDPAVVGREGVVVRASAYQESRAGVQLDGESEVRFFGAAELEELERPPLDPARETARARLARP